MKQNAVRLRAKKLNVLNREHILIVSAIVVIAWAGRASKIEYRRLKHIEQGSILLLRVYRSKIDKNRSFVIKGEIKND